MLKMRGVDTEELCSNLAENLAMLIIFFAFALCELQRITAWRLLRSTLVRLAFALPNIEAMQFIVKYCIGPGLYSYSASKCRLPAAGVRE